MKDEQVLVERVAQTISVSQHAGYSWPAGRTPDEQHRTRGAARVIIALVREHDRRKT